MTTTTTSPSNRGIKEIMPEQNVQSFIAKNKVAVYAILGVIVAALLGFGFYKTFADKSRAEYNDKIHTFETTVLKSYETNPADPKGAKAVEDGIMGLHLEMGEYLGLLPVVIKSSDALSAQGQNASARAVLSVGEKIARDDYARYFILSRQAVVYEDMGEDKLAIETLEKMTSLSAKIFEGKIYLDLGRLYLKSGDKEKAKKNFTYVVEKAKGEAEFVKLAELYLSKL